MMITTVSLFVCFNAKAEENTPKIKLTKFEVSVHDKYLLFLIPVVVSNETQLRTLTVFDFGKGFGGSVWTSSDLNGNQGNEIDYDLFYSYSFGKINLETGFGIWDVNPVMDGIDDIVTVYTKFTLGDLYVLPRYYHTDASFLGQGWNISYGLNKTFPITDRLSFSINPGGSYNDGFVATKNWNFLFGSALNFKLGEKSTVSLTGKIITDFDIDEYTGGIVYSRSF